MRKRQQYISRSSRNADEIKDIRSALDTSLGTVSRDPSLDPMLLEVEAKKLDDTIDYHSGVSPIKMTPSRRRVSPNRSGSPVRFGRTSSTPLSSAAPASYRRVTAGSARKYRS